MALNNRQVKLIRLAAKNLGDILYLAPDEAAELIGSVLIAELKESKTSMEMLDLSPLGQRAAFARRLVQRMKAMLVSKRTYPMKKIDESIDGFVKALHQSWRIDSLD